MHHVLVCPVFLHLGQFLFYHFLTLFPILPFPVRGIVGDILREKRDGLLVLDINLNLLLAWPASFSYPHILDA